MYRRRSRVAVCECTGHPAADVQKKSTALELAKRIATTYGSGSYRKAGHDPYPLTTRILLLSRMMDEAPRWNCKSGKDRTGFQDSRVRDFAMRIHLAKGEIPKLDAVRNETEIGNSQSIVSGGGNHQLQALNTGAPGYKIDINSLANQPGGKHNLKHDEGISFAMGS